MPETTMFELFSYAFMWRAAAAAILGGIACGIVGVWVILLNIPFVGVAMAHSAFAGAVLGLLTGIDPLLSALLMCTLAAGLVGPVADTGDVSVNISVGIIFSFVLGLAFLGVGLLPGPKTAALNFLWGSILTVSATQLWLLSAVAGMVVLVAAVFAKEILAVLFNRDIARAAGLPERSIFYLLLFLCGMVVTLNLNSIGGLLIFSLITSAPLAAYQLTYRLKTMYILSVLFAVFACLGGLLVSAALNVPSGAVIVILSGILFIGALYWSPKRRLPRGPQKRLL
jgi:manganese/iron transport system permease protein